jgi:hypothetical protein
MTGAVDARLASLHGGERLNGSEESKYLSHAEQDFAASDPSSEPDLLGAIRTNTGLDLKASKNVVVHEMRIGNRVYLFFANFDGLQPGVKATPNVQQDMQLRVPASFGTKLHWLPFMGNETTVEGEAAAEDIHFTLPNLERGAVAWFAPSAK